MSNRRIRLASAAALAVAAAMTLAAMAVAHPVDCDDPAAKFAGWSADWSAGEQCTVAPGGAAERVRHDGHRAAAHQRQRHARPPQAGRPQRADEPGHERGDRAQRRLRVHRQPHRRRPRGAAAGRHPRRRHQAPVASARGRRPVRRQARRVLARAARVALAGDPHRAQHELRRRAEPAPLHASRRSATSASTTSAAATRARRSCCISSTSTRTSSSSGRTRRTATGR